MPFVQFGMLASLGALAIPIVVHLMFRRQARPVELGTLQFLKVVLRDNARKRRLRRYVLLALRLACVALLAFLFARPYLVAGEQAEGDRLILVLVDRSASMGLLGGTRPIDRAWAEARAIEARAGSGTRVEIAAFDREVHPSSKSSAEPSGGGTDYDAAMAWARDVLVRSKGRLNELHVLTDLRKSGLGRGEAAKMPGDVAVRLVDLGRAFPKDVAVIGLSTSPSSPRPKEAAVVSAVVRNAGPLPVAKVPVHLHVEADGASPIDLDRSVDLEGDASATVEFPLPPMAEGLWRGHVEVNVGDDLPMDDRRYLALPVGPAARVLLVDGDPGRSSVEAETYFLKAALRLAPEGETYAKAPFDPTTVDLGDLRSGWPDLSRVACVVLANVADLPEAEAKSLAAYVNRGGGLVVFTGDRVTAEGSASIVASGLGVGQVLGPQAATDRPFRLGQWDESHPILRPFSEPEHGDIRRPAFSAITRVEPDPAVRVLARFRGGEPALIERAVGRGKVVWFASTGDRGWGDWPRGRMFVPMVHQMVGHASGLSEGGKARPELAAGDRKPGLVEAEGFVRVVNLDPYESEMARCTPKEFADRYGFRLPEAPAVASKSTQGKVDDRARPDELWPWLAMALMGALMFESFLANRTAA